MALSFRWKFKRQSRRPIGNRRLCLVPHTCHLMASCGLSESESKWLASLSPSWCRTGRARSDLKESTNIKKVPFAYQVIHRLATRLT
jgi:hypothetical protein